MPPTRKRGGAWGGRGEEGRGGTAPGGGEAGSPAAPPVPNRTEHLVISRHYASLLALDVLGVVGVTPVRPL